MTSFSKTTFACLSVGGLLFSSAGLIQAQDGSEPGYVRISDGPARVDNQATPAANGQVLPVNCQNCQTEAGGFNGAYTGCPQCQSGGCPQCYSPYGCSSWQHTQHLHAMLDWFNPYGACTHSPDHGYNPPIKSPIYRRGVAYTKYFPDAWTGNPSADMSGAPRAPIVYMPTDTTQLGYYYQHAPRWMPVRGMVPPAPTPNQWHYTCSDKQQCNIAVEGVIIDGHDGTMPADASQGIPGNVIEAQPNAAPIESAPVAPPAPPAVPAPAPVVERASL